MKKATYSDAGLIARSMNMKVDVVYDIIGGMNYGSYSELVMAVLICLKPLPLERLKWNRSGSNEDPKGGVT